jgi:hypothetical protein
MVCDMTKEPVSEDYSLKTPILFLVFNRPDTTQLVFKEIRKARPPRLYISADGPRMDKAGEAEKVRQVRKLITEGIDWDCEVNILFREQNLGCRGAVSSGISWFFEREEAGIILEDDCVPDLSFFRFCQELLQKYFSDTRIMTISGNNFQFGRRRTEYSYYFSRHPHIWGWATWRRAWNLFDTKMTTWPQLSEGQWLMDVFRGDEFAIPFWENIFQSVYSGNIDSWAYIWTMSSWTQEGLSIIPDRNLVSNIGFGPQATHTKTNQNRRANMAINSMTFPLDHPPFVIRNAKADEFTEKEVFQHTAVRWRYRKFRRYVQPLKNFFKHS